MINVGYKIHDHAIDLPKIDYQTIGAAGLDLYAANSEKINLILGNICCHKSIRSGRILNLDEMNALLREMEVTPNSGQCNHGRPTSIALSVKQIEKLFERI